MGYRSTFVTEALYFETPEWFNEKWQTLSYGEWDGKKGFPLASTFERKFYYGVEDELFIDLARVIRENTETYPNEVTLALLHEDGEIDRITITAEKITLQGSLKHDPEDDDNWQLGRRDKEYIIPSESGILKKEDNV